jgi:hypothetical protein
MTISKYPYYSEWLMIETSDIMLEIILHGGISVREAFINQDYVYRLAIDSNNSVAKLKIRPDKIPDDDLPDAKLRLNMEELKDGNRNDN